MQVNLQHMNLLSFEKICRPLTKQPSESAQLIMLSFLLPFSVICGFNYGQNNHYYDFCHT